MGWRRTTTMTYKLEFQWVTAEKYQVCVIKTSMGHRFGYVGLDYFHSLAQLDHTSFLRNKINVHSGITYCSELNKYHSATLSGKKLTYPMKTERNLWWFGFNTNHLDDHDFSLEYCINECNSLSLQLKKLGTYINAYEFQRD